MTAKVAVVELTKVVEEGNPMRVGAFVVLEDQHGNKLVGTIKSLGVGQKDV